MAQLNSVNNNIQYVSDNPRKIGGITFNAVRSDIVDSVKMMGVAQANKYLKFMLLAAISEYAFIFGHDEAIKELQYLLMTQEVVKESEMNEVA